ncbi:28S ribosomal protein S14, mitochondrial [Orchesella cincta]|uniref:28S ribosomal protein S14, mitochondrial n=1 Tax=Orchesella cincta TaxID=48709 RepID=A0A1D2M105_ORCCI|nr:28S ribosomal protein S14, mitochondrial [Orchesella cincta]
MQSLQKPLKLISETFLKSHSRLYASASAKSAVTKAATTPTTVAADAPPKKKRPLEPAQEEHPYRLDRWTDWRMKKDYLRRQCVIKLGRKRSMLMTLHQNNILPVEIRDLAKQEMEDDLPRDSNHTRLTRRCAITSRPRATVEPWRISRFIFRDLADHSKLSGVQRAIW